MGSLEGVRILRILGSRVPGWRSFAMARGFGFRGLGFCSSRRASGFSGFGVHGLFAPRAESSGGFIDELPLTRLGPGGQGLMSG